MEDFDDNCAGEGLDDSSIPGMVILFVSGLQGKVTEYNGKYLKKLNDDDD